MSDGRFIGLADGSGKAAEPGCASPRRDFTPSDFTIYLFLFVLMTIFALTTASPGRTQGVMTLISRLDIEMRPPGALRPYAGNARRHSRKQVQQIAASIRRFGFTNPILVSDGGEIIAGHGRVEAAKLLGLRTVPTLRLSHLSEAERRAYGIADNKIALNSGWDQETLALEFEALAELEFDVSLTGFTSAEVDLTLDAARDASPRSRGDRSDETPALGKDAVSRPGDMWLLGRHRVICGDARRREVYDQLLEGRKADLIFTDPPYNVAIDGNVTGKGVVTHREFAMGAGEMTQADFIDFLTITLGRQARASRDGAIAFVAMDWRHMGEVLTAGREVFSELKNLCVWNKTNAGLGRFYRSKHELIFVFKVGDGPHVNNFGLGADGRYRTNVWDYAGVSGGGRHRAEALAMHPTVKPVALVADAIRDCSRRGDLVLDGFAGSGTTLIAAEQCGRIARLIEIDPLYVDTIVRRFERVTGQAAVLADTGASFDDTEDARIAEDIG